MFFFFFFFWLGTCTPSGKIPERRCGGVIDGGDAGSRNYYGETDLEDLNSPAEPERIVLDMREQERYFEGSAATSQSAKRKRSAEEEGHIVAQMADRLANHWRPDLGKFRIPKHDVNQSTRLMLDNISIRCEQLRGFNEGKVLVILYLFLGTREEVSCRLPY
jgi:transcription initiation factor TFIIH subunit 1